MPISTDADFHLARHVVEADPAEIWAALSATLQTRHNPVGGGRESVPVKLLQDESHARIIAFPDQRADRWLVRKNYRVERSGRWRTLGVPARAKREFGALRLASGRGLPVVEPVDFQESRRRGLLTHSSITTVFQHGRNMRLQLLDLAPGDPLRGDLAGRAGRLLAQLHRCGLLWMTPYTRNLLVPEQPGEGPDAVALDMPYAMRFGGNIHARMAGVYDLRILGACFESTGRGALLDAYCGGDDEPAARLERILSNHRRRRHRMQRRWLRSLYMLGLRRP